MSKTRNIKVELPFAFCEECENVDVEEVAFFSVYEKAESYRICKNAKICEETMRLYFKRKEDGREWR